MVPNLGNPKVTLFGSFWGHFLDLFGDTFWTILGTTFGDTFWIILGRNIFQHDLETFSNWSKKEIQNPSETVSPKCSKNCRKSGSKKCPETRPQRLSKKCCETGPLYVQKTEPFGTAYPRKPLSLARTENNFQHDLKTYVPKIISKFMSRKHFST